MSRLIFIFSVATATIYAACGIAAICAVDDFVSKKIAPNQYFVWTSRGEPAASRDPDGHWTFHRARMIYGALFVCDRPGFEGMPVRILVAAPLLALSGAVAGDGRGE
jgi:hypothetical protein